jgi:hypothetical protein
VVQQPFDEGDPSQSHPIRTKSHGSEADPRPEQTITDGLRTFVGVGRALTRIRVAHLYRARGYTSFEGYCQERWGFKKSRAYQLIDAVGVVENVHNCGSAPTNEAQARELGKLPTAGQAEAWMEVVRTAPDGVITATHVRAVVAKRLPAGTPTNPVLLRMVSDPKFRVVVKAFDDPKILGSVPDSAPIPQQLVDQYPEEFAGLGNVGALRRSVRTTPLPPRVRRPMPQRTVGTPNSLASAPVERPISPGTEMPDPDAEPDSDDDVVTAAVMAFRASLTTLCATFSLKPEDFLDLVRLHEAQATTEDFLEALGMGASLREAQTRYDAVPKKKSKEGNDLRKELNAADERYQAFVAKIVKRAKG